VKDVLPSSILLLESNDRKECPDHSMNCVPCHLSIEKILHPELVVVLDNLSLIVCGEKKMQILCCCVTNVNVVSI